MVEKAMKLLSEDEDIEEQIAELAADGIFGADTREFRFMLGYCLGVLHQRGGIAETQGYVDYVLDFLESDKEVTPNG
jgi:hypothetical protein